MDDLSWVSSRTYLGLPHPLFVVTDNNGPFVVSSHDQSCIMVTYRNRTTDELEILSDLHKSTLTTKMIPTLEQFQDLLHSLDGKATAVSFHTDPSIDVPCVVLIVDLTGYVARRIAGN